MIVREVHLLPENYFLIKNIILGIILNWLKATQNVRKMHYSIDDKVFFPLGPQFRGQFNLLATMVKYLIILIC